MIIIFVYLKFYVIPLLANIKFKQFSLAHKYLLNPVPRNHCNLSPTWLSLQTEDEKLLTEVTEYYAFLGNFKLCVCFFWASQVASGKEPPADAGDIRGAGLIPGSRRHPGGGNDNPPQYSCLENPMDRGAWRVLWVAKNQPQLKQLRKCTCFSTSSSPYFLKKNT